MDALLAERWQVAQDAGMVQSQLLDFLVGCYVPQKRQCDFHAAAALCHLPGGPSRVGYGGTRGQAKSHAVYAQATLDDMQRFDGLKGLYLRKVQKKAVESFDDLRRKVLQFTPHTYKAGVLTLPNGSRMIMGGFRSEGDIDTYLGLEYDFIILEDATTLTETKRTAIGGALRTSRTDGWRCRMYESANPGGVGHAWFRKMYFDPWVKGQETTTRFIHTTKGDNRYIDKEYDAYLDGLTGWLRRAWRDGDFEISAGVFFDNWDADRVVVASFPRPADRGGRHRWTYWLALDWGYTHWCVCYLLGESAGTVYVIDEHAERRWQVGQHVDGIMGMLHRYGLAWYDLDRFVAGADMFSVVGDQEVSVAEKFERAGMPVTRANMDRVSGAAEILHRLGNDKIPATLRIFDRCHRLIECLPLMQHNPSKPEDVLKVDANDMDGSGGDDPYDALRYGLMRGGATRLTVGPNPVGNRKGIDW